MSCLCQTNTFSLQAKHVTIRYHVTTKYNNILWVTRSAGSSQVFILNLIIQLINGYYNWRSTIQQIIALENTTYVPSARLSMEVHGAGEEKDNLARYSNLPSTAHLGVIVYNNCWCLISVQGVCISSPSLYLLLR